MSKEAMKLALEALADAHHRVEHKQDAVGREKAMSALRKALADFWEGYVPEPVKLAQCAPAEDGVCEALDCSNHKPAQQALDKKAENARELGLDYEPVCNKDPQGCWNVRCQLGKKCKEQPTQQEPVAWVGLDLDGMVEAFHKVIEEHHSRTNPFNDPVNKDAMIALRELRGLIAYMKRNTSPPAQPQQEPVARQYQNRDGVWKDFISEKHYKDTLEDGSWPIRNLYTSPPAQRTWVGLTDEEVINVMPDDDTPMSLGEAFSKFAEFIEAKLRSKNEDRN